MEKQPPQQPGFVQPGQPGFVEPQKKKMHGCVIAIIVAAVAIVVIIGILAVIAIPSLKKAKRTTNEMAALATVKNFQSVAYAYSSENNGAYWEDGTSDFASYFNFAKIKNDYIYSYFSDDDNYNGMNEATAFVFLAIPIKYSDGGQMFGIGSDGILYSYDLQPNDTGILLSAKLIPNWSDAAIKKNIKALFPDFDWKKK